MWKAAAFIAFLCLGSLAGLASFAQDTPVPAAASASEPSLSDMIGQMVMIGFEGDSVNAPAFRRTLAKAKQGHITGVLYLQRNITSRRNVQAMNKAMQDAAKQPLLIAVDQEGGAIQRLPQAAGFLQVPSARSIARRTTPRQAYETYGGLASYLQRWGFNLNLGPVADLDVNPANPIIGRLGRSFSADPSIVVQYCAAFVEGHREHGVLTALKHFPGHGSSRADSHEGWTDVTKTSTPAEIEVFRILIAQGYADMVMSGHTYDAQFQSGARKLPSSLEPGVLRDLLRDKLGFRGAVISDDLQMSAVSGQFSLKDTVVSAVLAGNDIIVFGNAKSVDPDIDVKVTTILSQAAEKDPAVKKAIVAAFGRILKLKSRLPRA